MAQWQCHQPARLQTLNSLLLASCTLVRVVPCNFCGPRSFPNRPATDFIAWNWEAATNQPTTHLLHSADKYSPARPRSPSAPPASSLTSTPTPLSSNLSPRNPTTCTILAPTCLIPHTTRHEVLRHPRRRDPRSRPGHEQAASMWCEYPASPFSLTTDPVLTAASKPASTTCSAWHRRSTAQTPLLRACAASPTSATESATAPTRPAAMLPWLTKSSLTVLPTALVSPSSHHSYHSPLTLSRCRRFSHGRISLRCCYRRSSPHPLICRPIAPERHRLGHCFRWKQCELPYRFCCIRSFLGRLFDRV